MRATTTFTTLILALGALACAEGEDAEPAAEGMAEAEGEAAAAGEVDDSALQRWDVRLDEEGASGNFQMVEEGEGWRVRTGPAGVAWRPVNMVEQGDFTARASFQEMGAQPGHREGYGLLVGGFHLESPDQRYTYFLVRGTGHYLVKRRNGEETSTLTDWTASDAVNAIESPGDEPTNTLAVRVQGDSVRFVVNDQVVETLPAEEVQPWGLVGLRVNHNLDLQVSGVDVEEASPEQGQMPD